MNTIIEFLKTGVLGNIKIGQTKNSVEKYLGVPEGISYNKSFITLKYGSIQLSFYRKGKEGLEDYILKHIHIDFDNSVNFPNTLDLDGWLPTPDMSYPVFVEETKKYNVRICKDEQHTFKNLQIGTKSDSGVIIIFDDENEGNKIISMSLFNPS